MYVSPHIYLATVTGEDLLLRAAPLPPRAAAARPALQRAARAARSGGGAACANACADDDQGPAGIRSQLAASRAGAQLIACFRKLLRERRINELGGAAHRAHRKIGVYNGF